MRKYKVVFPGFYFCLTDPGLGAREAGNPETPKGVDKNKLQKKPALSNQSQQLPYSGQTQGNKLRAHPSSTGWVGSAGVHPQLAVMRCSVSPPHPHWLVSEKTEMETGPSSVVTSTPTNCGISGSQAGSSTKVPLPPHIQGCVSRGLVGAWNPTSIH